MPKTLAMPPATMSERRVNVAYRLLSFASNDGISGPALAPHGTDHSALHPTHGERDDRIEQHGNDGLEKQRRHRRGLPIDGPGQRVGRDRGKEHRSGKAENGADTRKSGQRLALPVGE